MQVNIGQNGFGNIGAVREMQGAASAGAAESAARAEKTAGGLTITESASALDEISGIEVSEESLTRDDPLGRLMEKAFSFPPPPMPNFAE